MTWGCCVDPNSGTCLLLLGSFLTVSPATAQAPRVDTVMGSSPLTAVCLSFCPHCCSLGCDSIILSTAADLSSKRGFRSRQPLLPSCQSLHLISRQQTHLSLDPCNLISCVCLRYAVPSVLSTFPHTLFCDIEGKNVKFLNL